MKLGHLDSEATGDGVRVAIVLRPGAEGELVGSCDEAEGLLCDDKVVVVPGKGFVGIGGPDLVFEAIDSDVYQACTARREADFDLVNDAVGQVHGGNDWGRDRC